MISICTLHLYTPENNHVASDDCWCEPARSYWITDKDGRQVHVFEHNEPDEGTVPQWVDQRLEGVGKD